MLLRCCLGTLLPVCVQLVTQISLRLPASDLAYLSCQVQLSARLALQCRMCQSAPAASSMMLHSVKDALILIWRDDSLP
jgi:hypothetical protein